MGGDQAGRDDQYSNDCQDEREHDPIGLSLAPRGPSERDGRVHEIGSAESLNDPAAPELRNAVNAVHWNKPLAALSLPRSLLRYYIKRQQLRVPRGWLGLGFGKKDAESIFVEPRFAVYRPGCRIGIRHALNVP